MGYLPTCSLKKDILMTQTRQEGGQEVSLSINPSNISLRTSQWLKESSFICQLLSAAFLEWKEVVLQDLHLTLDVQHMHLSVLKKKAERNWFWCHLNICKVDAIWYLSELCKKMAIAIICSNWLPYYCNIHMIIVQQSLETKAIFS